MTDFPSGWTRRTLGDLGTYMNGMAFKPSDWTSDGLPIIRIQNLMDPAKPFNRFSGNFDSRYRIQDGDLLISWSASLGAFIWDRGEAILNQHIFRVEVNDDLVEKHFLCYLVLHMLDEMARHAHGSTMKHITKRKFEALGVSVPSMQEQRRIVGQIREAFERLREIRKLRRQIHSEAATVLPTLLADCFGDSTKAHPIRTVDHVSLETKYGTSRRCSRNQSGSPVLRIPNVADGEVSFVNLKWCDQLSEGELSKLLLQDGDLLVVRTNGSRDLVGRCAVFQDQDRPYAYASYLIRIRPDREHVHPQFLAFFLESTMGHDAIAERMRTSAGQYNINSKNLRSILFPCPPLDVQRSIVEQMVHQRRVVNEIVAVHSEMQDQDVALRQAVLHKAFAGEL